MGTMGYLWYAGSALCGLMWLVSLGVALHRWLYLRWLRRIPTTSIAEARPGEPVAIEGTVVPVGEGHTSLLDGERCEYLEVEATAHREGGTHSSGSRKVVFVAPTETPVWIRDETGIAALRIRDRSRYHVHDSAMIHVLGYRSLRGKVRAFFESQGRGDDWAKENLGEGWRLWRLQVWEQRVRAGATLHAMGRATTIDAPQELASGYRGETRRALCIEDGEEPMWLDGMSRKEALFQWRSGLKTSLQVGTVTLGIAVVLLLAGLAF